MTTPWILLAAAAAAGPPLGAAVGAAARRLSFDRSRVRLWRVAAVQTCLLVWGVLTSAGPERALVSGGLSAALLLLALVDVAALRLPDVVTLPLALAGVLLGVWRRGDGVGPLIGAAVGFLSLALLAAAFRRLRGREGLGLGDAKLLGAAGAWVGWRALPFAVSLACALAFGWVAVRAVRQGRSALAQPLPFGAPLALAFWLVWLYGAPTG